MIHRSLIRCCASTSAAQSVVNYSSYALVVGNQALHFDSGDTTGYLLFFLGVPVPGTPGRTPRFPAGVYVFPVQKISGVPGEPPQGRERSCCISQ